MGCRLQDVKWPFGTFAFNGDERRFDERW
jgi:hypothetical protein